MTTKIFPTPCLVFSRVCPALVLTLIDGGCDAGPDWNTRIAGLELNPHMITDLRNGDYARWRAGKGPLGSIFPKNRRHRDLDASGAYLIFVLNDDPTIKTVETLAHRMVPRMLMVRLSRT